MLGRSRLSYANITATLALFISLGGASYAAVTLPEHSVGPRQLKAGAVTPGALSFPLGVTGVTDQSVEDFVKTVCNGAKRPGEVVTVLCPPGFSFTGKTPGREVVLSLRTRGQLLISVVTGLKNAGPEGKSAQVTIGIVVDRRSASKRETAVSGGQHVYVPFQLLVPARAGTHTVGVAVDAHYSYWEPGDVIVSPVSLIVSALPVAS
jgi:hypothetical protein